VLEFDFKYAGLGPATMAFGDMSGIGRGGTGVLKVDGKEVATRQIPYSMPVIMNFDEMFDVGIDTRTGVDDKDYKVPFRFNGKIEKLTFKLGPPQITAADQKKAAQMNVKARD
jgi:arylsulfatase